MKLPVLDEHDVRQALSMNACIDLIASTQVAISSGDIGEVIAGRVVGRKHRNDITVYKNPGNTAQDLATAHYVYTHTRTT